METSRLSRVDGDKLTPLIEKKNGMFNEYETYLSRRELINGCATHEQRGLRTGRVQRLIVPQFTQAGKPNIMSYVVQAYEPDWGGRRLKKPSVQIFDNYLKGVDLSKLSPLAKKWLKELIDIGVKLI